MLRSIKQLEGSGLRATDGDIGRVRDVYFDDERWTVRYLVVDTSLLATPVLISPISVRGVDIDNERIDVALTREQVRASPTIDLHRPISRRYEDRYSAYYGFMPYWGGEGYWGLGTTPGALAGAQVLRDQEILDSPAPDEEEGPDSHLHSSHEVFGYHISAIDGEIGHVDDFIIEEGTWVIRYMRVDTSNFIGGKAVLVSAAALLRVDWPEQVIHVGVTREAVASGPEYDAKLLNRDFEGKLHQHYGHPPYWS